MGIEFDPWQDSLGQLVFSLDADNLYAATVGGVVLSIPRQVGKTFFVGAVLIAFCIAYPGTTVLWTSHHLRTSTKTFRSMQGLLRRKSVKPHLAPGRNDGIRTANGEQEVSFRNGSLLMFGARTMGFGRGMDKIDVEVFDEAQILDDKSLEDMVAATNQTQHPHGALLFYMGTPPKPTDPGEVFAAQRAKALSGEAEDMVYVEFGADPDADPDDREQWSKANPSYPLRTPLPSMLRLREHLRNEDSWKREGLGIWDPVLSKGIIPAPSWADAQDADSLALDRFALGVEVGPDLAWASVGLAGQRADEGWHIELSDDQHTRGAGTVWLVPHVQAMVAANPQVRAVVADVGGPVSALLEQRRDGQWFFIGTDVLVTPMRVTDLGSACSLVLDGVVTGWLHHIGQPQLSTAALSAGKRALGDTGKWVWSRKTATSDITPIQACTLALWGARSDAVAEAKKPSVVHAF